MSVKRDKKQIRDILTLVEQSDENIAGIASQAQLRQEAAEGNSDHLTLAVEPPALCDVAAHLERPKRERLPHWNLTEMAAFHDWAARQLAPRRFRMEFPAGSIFRDLPSGRYLADPVCGRVELPEL